MAVHFNSKHAGFSYVGLLILITIIGALAAGALMSGAALQRHAAEDELLFVGGQFQAAFKTYYESTPLGSRPYPGQFSELLLDPRFPATRRHLRQIFNDPLTGKPEWGIVEAPGGGVMGVYSLSTETPIRSAGFEVEFAAFEGKSKYSEWVFTYVPPVTANAGVNTAAVRN